jgi:hypothetical protein
MSEIYEVIENIDGVDYIEGVRLSANGPGTSLDGRVILKWVPIVLLYPAVI